MSATSCCCAPSWRLRSILRRSSSWASTSLRRDARSSSTLACSSAVSRTLRSTRPACDARSSTSLSSVGVSGSFRGLVSVIAPSSSRRCRTATARVMSNAGSASPARERDRLAAGASAGHAATGRSSPPTRSHTSTRVAPVPVSEDRRHPLQDVLQRVRAGHPLREVGEHLIRRRSIAVDEPVRQALRATSAAVGTAARSRPQRRS